MGGLWTWTETQVTKEIHCNCGSSSKPANSPNADVSLDALAALVVGAFEPAEPTPALADAVAAVLAVDAPVAVVLLVPAPVPEADPVAVVVLVLVVGGGRVPALLETDWVEDTKTFPPVDGSV